MLHIHKQVEDALSSVDNIDRAEPKPFFYTRLEARLAKNRSNRWETLSRAISKPAIAFATLAIVLILNAAVVVQGLNAVSDVPDFSEMTTTEDLRSSISFYDIENNQP